MTALQSVLGRIGEVLTFGIAGTQFTLLTVVTLMALLVWVTRRATRWLVDRVLRRAPATSWCGPTSAGSPGAGAATTEGSGPIHDQTRPTYPYASIRPSYCLLVNSYAE
jgi:hypothetical protein